MLNVLQHRDFISFVLYVGQRRSIEDLTALRLIVNFKKKISILN